MKAPGTVSRAKSLAATGQSDRISEPSDTLFAIGESVVVNVGHGAKIPAVGERPAARPARIRIVERLRGGARPVRGPRERRPPVITIDVEVAPARMDKPVQSWFQYLLSQFSRLEGGAETRSFLHSKFPRRRPSLEG